MCPGDLPLWQKELCPQQLPMHEPASPVHDCACCHHVHALTLVPSLDNGLQAARACVRAQVGLPAVINWLDGCVASIMSMARAQMSLHQPLMGLANALVAAISESGAQMDLLQPTTGLKDALLAAMSISRAQMGLHQIGWLGKCTVGSN